ncbi:MAG: hypothetical protein BECKG1743D_GA0114223_111591, partial [Candidatus Kentron sp. G]
MVIANAGLLDGATADDDNRYYTGDTVILVMSEASGSFDSGQIGVGKTVTVDHLALSGSDADNYLLAPYTTVANIITNYTENPLVRVMVYASPAYASSVPTSILIPEPLVKEAGFSDSRFDFSSIGNDLPWAYNEYKRVPDKLFEDPRREDFFPEPETIRRDTSIAVSYQVDERLGGRFQENDSPWTYNEYRRVPDELFEGSRRQDFFPEPETIRRDTSIALGYRADERLGRRFQENDSPWTYNEYRRVPDELFEGPRRQDFFPEPETIRRDTPKTLGYRADERLGGRFQENDSPWTYNEYRRVLDELFEGPRRQDFFPEPETIRRDTPK